MNINDVDKILEGTIKNHEKEITDSIKLDLDRTLVDFYKLAGRMIIGKIIQLKLLGDLAGAGFTIERLSESTVAELKATDFDINNFYLVMSRIEYTNDEQDKIRKVLVEKLSKNF